MSMEISMEKMLETLFDKHKTVHRMTLFQIKYFIVGKETTVQGRMRRCLLELETRKTTLKSFDLAVEDARDGIALLKIKQEKLQSKSEHSKLNKEEKTIRVRQLQRKINSYVEAIEDINKKKKECEEECTLLLTLFLALEKIEPLADFDDFETNAKIWNEKLTQELELQLLLKRPLDPELIKTALAMTDNAPIKAEVTNILKQLQLASHQIVTAQIQKQETDGQ